MSRTIFLILYLAYPYNGCGGVDMKNPCRKKHTMIRVSLSYVYSVAAGIEPLTQLRDNQDTPFSELYLLIAVAFDTVSQLNAGSIYSGELRSSRALARQLMELLQSQIDNNDYNRIVTPIEIWRIKNVCEQYKIALMAELSSLSLYFVTRKGGFDTLALLEFAESLFPNELVVKVPESSFDAREAGRCLAYESSTAAGFHLFRVLECVIRRYYTHETNGAAPPKVRSIKTYVRALQTAKKGDPKVLFLLEQIADGYRNPLIHPDAAIDFDQAVTIQNLVRAAVSAMLAILPAPIPTTTSPSVASSTL
jgi:hypothetical protein